MHKKASKVISLVLVLVFCVVFLIACSKSSGSVSDSDMEKELDELEKSNEVTLHFLLQGEKKKDTQTVLEEVATRSNLNIKLNFEWYNYDYDYDKHLTLILASNVPLDAFYVGRPDFYDNDYISLANKGDLKDITELLPKYAPNIYTKLTKEALSAIKVNGKIYTVPSLYPESLCQYVAVDYDLMKKYNTPPISTFEDYEVYLSTIKENEKNVIPGSMLINAQLFARAYDYIILDNALNLVYKRDDPKMKIIPWEQTSEFKQIVSMLVRWRENDYFKKEGDDPKTNIASFINTAPFVIEGPTTEAYADSEGNRKTYNVYRSSLYPAKPYQRLNPIGNRRNNGAIALNNKSNNVDRALMFLDWIQSSQENYDLFMYGIKGNQYELVGERISLPKNFDNTKSSYIGWSNSPFRNIEFNRLNSNLDVPDDYNKSCIEFINTKTVYAPHEGFAPNNKNVPREATERKNIYSREIDYALYKGTLKVENVDTIIQKLKDAGTDRLVYEIQKQLDDWVATNK